MRRLERQYRAAAAARQLVPDVYSHQLTDTELFDTAAVFSVLPPQISLHHPPRVIKQHRYGPVSANFSSLLGPMSHEMRPGVYTVHCYKTWERLKSVA